MAASTGIVSPSPQQPQPRLRSVLLALLLLLVAGAWPGTLALMRWMHAKSDQVLAARGKIATGRVFEKTGPPPFGNASSNAPFVVWYNFAPVSGSASQLTHESVTRAEWLSLSKDGPVDIRYDPEDASNFQIDYANRLALRPSSLEIVYAALRSLFLAALIAWGAYSRRRRSSQDPGNP